MAKRFTNTDKWDDDWFLSLSPRLKCLWNWLCDHCDGVGLQKLSLTKISNEVGEPITRADLDNFFSERLHWVKDDTVWIHGFIRAQYKVLSPNNRAHMNIALKAIRELQGQSLKGKAKETYERLLAFVQSEADKTPPNTPDPQARPARPSGEAELGDIGNRKKEIGNRKELEGSVRGDWPPQPNWPFDAPEEFGPVVISFCEFPQVALTALSSVPVAAQNAWLTAYPDVGWIRQEVLSCLAHLAIKPPKSAFTTFGSFLGNWLKNNWARRKPGSSDEINYGNVFGGKNAG